MVVLTTLQRRVVPGEKAIQSTRIANKLYSSSVCRNLLQFEKNNYFNVRVQKCTHIIIITQYLFDLIKCHIDVNIIISTYYNDNMLII